MGQERNKKSVVGCLLGALRCLTFYGRRVIQRYVGAGCGASRVPGVGTPCSGRCYPVRGAILRAADFAPTLLPVVSVIAEDIHHRGAARQRNVHGIQFGLAEKRAES